MKEQKKLYPIRFNEETLEYPWGRETFSLADLGVVDSVAGNGWLAGNAFSDIMETYLERVGGEDVYKYYGRQFPVSVSFLDISGVFPARCHPDDEAAGQRYDALGKRVFWRVLEAAPDARLYIGFARDMSWPGLCERLSMSGPLLQASLSVLPRGLSMQPKAE